MNKGKTGFEDVPVTEEKWRIDGLSEEDPGEGRILVHIVRANGTFADRLEIVPPIMVGEDGANNLIGKGIVYRVQNRPDGAQLINNDFVLR